MADIKDANDWLKAMVAENLSQEEQVGRVQEALAAADPLVVMVARWIGGDYLSPSPFPEGKGGEPLRGAARDEAVRLVFRMVGGLDKMERAQYRSQLSKLLGINIREFNDLAKAAPGEGKVSELPVQEVIGGWFNGWLVEYVYDPASDKASFAFRDPERKIGSADHLDIEGVRYVPREVNAFVRSGGVLFPSGIGALKGIRELAAIIEGFIQAHYLLENEYMYRIVAYYVLLTWVYDAFNALPYLRAVGEAGAGKSELMRRVGYMCYRMMTASGANTSASFFRATETYRGTVFIDEADLHDGGDMSNDIVKFLNLGAMKGNPIWRLEERIGADGSKNYEVNTFSTFCPKLIAMRKEFRDDAVMSRSLTLKLMPREPIELKAAGVKLYIDDDFREKAAAIRNLLLRWRLQVWEPEISTGEELMDVEISSRLNQVTMPLKALAREDAALIQEIEVFLREYNGEIILTRSMTLGARLVEALWKIYRYPDLNAKYVRRLGTQEYVMVGDVRMVANELIDAMNAEGEEEEPTPDPSLKGGERRRKKEALTARGVGALIRNELQLRVGQRRGPGFPVFWDEMKMKGLAKRYGVDYEGIGKLEEMVEGEKSQRVSESAKQSELGIAN